MQNCHRCSIVSIINSPCDVYLSATESYLLKKAINFFETKNFALKPLNDVIQFVNVDFKGFINSFKETNQFTETERQQILLAVLEHGKLISPQDLFLTKSLDVWIELLQSDDLLNIIKDRKINIFFQPIFSADKVKPYAFECLSRGIAEDGRIIPPLYLFNQARILGLQFQLDKLTREVAIEQAYNQGIKNHKIFINFLPTAIYNPRECLATTMMAASQIGINPNNIVFEVVESEQVKDISHLKSILDFYREMGFKTALDDFGSGYASLKMLEILDVDYIKIDMHFIKDIYKDKFKQDIVNSIISLAKGKSIMTLAEGIETQREFECIKKLGIDLVQGYFFARPSTSLLKYFL
ncbi:MAG TPA: EAL domain-containing protein [Nitrospirae bacterium]|nr:EAL domain-containing protein [Nitrospirota bacterium]